MGSNTYTLKHIADSVVSAADSAAKGMENTAFVGDADKTGMELTGVKVSQNHNSDDHRCQPDVCRALNAHYLQQNTKMSSDPWDRLKTVFLCGIIGLLVLWLLVYVASSRLGLV